MNTTEKYSLAELVIRHALKNGAQQVAVTIDENRSTEIEIRDQVTDSLKESVQNSLSVNLFVDKKYSSHSTNRMKKEELFRFIEEAIAATRYLSEDAFRSLPEPELFYKGGGSDLGNYDAGLDGVDTKAKIDLSNAALNEAYKKDDRVISVSAYYADNIGSTVKMTSNGFRGDSANSNVNVSVSVSAKSDSGRPSDYWYENALFFDRLKKTEIGTKALERTLRKIGPKKIASGNYQVVIENRVATNLLWPVFQSLQARSIDQKQSFLIGKIDKPIASKLLTVTDDPLIPSGFASRHFDAEGLASVKRLILEKGVLRNYYIDNYYGKKLGLKPTSGGSSNVVFEAGTRTMDEMVRSMKKGVLITGFIGGNCNGATGDFSYGIEGFYLENGKIIHPVNEMNISGNMNSFWFNLAEMGSDIQENSSYKIPSMLFDGVDLSGL